MQDFTYWHKKYPSFELIRKINTGKEADVFLCEIQDKKYALKIYRDDFLKKSNAEYLEGKHFREKSHQRAVTKKTKFGKKIIKKVWTRREFYMLKKFFELGCNVPEVFDYSDDSLIMQFIGDDLPAPKLAEIELSADQKLKVYQSLKDSMELFLKEGIVHGDLNIYNVLFWQNKPWIIDFPQSIDIRKNPNWEEFYKKDLENLELIQN